jgi:hypothetical protein
MRLFDDCLHLQSRESGVERGREGEREREIERERESRLERVSASDGTCAYVSVCL